jgi:hypothetical protein
VSIGTLVRAIALVALSWIVVLGPRSYPSVVAALDEASLPRATLRVETTSCERPDIDSLRWTCRAGGPLAAAAPTGVSSGVYFYEILGEEPEGRYDIGDEVQVAIVRGLLGGATLLDGIAPGTQAEARLRWLIRQPTWSLAAAGLAWLLLVAAGWQQRARAGVLELITWPGAPAVGLASFGLAVALAAGPWFDGAFGGGLAAPVLLTGLAAASLQRAFWRFDRTVGTRTRGRAVGAWCLFEAPVRLGAATDVHLFETTRIGTPWDQHRLVLAEFGAMHEIVRARPRRAERMGRALAAYLHVPLRDPLGDVVGGVPAPVATREPVAFDLDEGDRDEDILDETRADEHDPDLVEAPETFPPLSSERHHPGLRVRWQNAPRGLAALAVVAAAALGVTIVRAGGIDPFAERLLAPEVSAWPAGGVIRRAAVQVAAWRDLHPDTLDALVRLAHTLDADEPLWRPVMLAAQRVLRLDLPLDEPHDALARLDVAASRALDRPLGPLGALGWRELDQYFVESLDDMAGGDVALAVERFNGLVPPDGLPTAEWYLAWLGPALADRRPIAFAIVAVGSAEIWKPLAVPPDEIEAGARRIRAATVGEALAVGLWGLPRYRPASPDVDVAGWWTPIAEQRGLPRVAPIIGR